MLPWFGKQISDTYYTFILVNAGEKKIFWNLQAVVDTRNITDDCTTSCTYWAKCGTEVFAYFFSSGTPLIGYTGICLVWSGVILWICFLFLFVLFLCSLLKLFLEPFCRLVRVFSDFRYLHVISLHFGELPGVLFVPNCSCLHSGSNSVISEIKAKNCMYFQGNRTCFCFVCL